MVGPRPMLNRFLDRDFAGKTRNFCNFYARNMVNNEESPEVVDRTLLTTAMTVAPTAVGCAVGVLLGGQLKKDQRSTVATALFTLGALVAVPAAVDCVTKLINGPVSKAGAKRTLKGIRQGAGVGYPFEDEFDDHRIEDFSDAFKQAN